MRVHMPSIVAVFVLFTCNVVSAVGADLPTSPSEEEPIEQLLSRVPDGATWQDIAPDLRAAFESRASLFLDADRRSWGLSGLEEKERVLLGSPTPAMIENIDRVLSIAYASELPAGFKMTRDVRNTELKRHLIRIYLSTTESRGFILYNHRDFKGWDGLPIKELQLLDHENFKTMTEWLRQTDDGLRKIPSDQLTPLEIALRNKTYFTTRAGKYFDKPAVGRSGAMGYSGLYALPHDLRPFESDTALLDAYNASMFSEFRDVNMGTLDAFMFDHESEFSRVSLAGQGMSAALIDDVIKLGDLFKSRVQALPERIKRCTIYSPSEIAANWDAFTAGQISNADGAETMQSYARSFEQTAAARLTDIRSVARQTLEALFPEGSPELTPDQRSKVIDRLLVETRPAMIKDTLVAALDEITGNTTASAKVREAEEKQQWVGGNYTDGESVREADRIQILDMWKKLRAFIKREYHGYRIEIADLIPEEPHIRTSGQNQYTLGGQVYLSVATRANLASFSSTFMHEMKHAIDQNSKAAVEGSAWEGAATSVERQVWPMFIEEAMAGEAPRLAIARLTTEIDNVRFTATTDATLKIFLRETCADDEDDTIAYAKNIVRSYGYNDAGILELRSRRAHRGTQYLQYDYGLVLYNELLSYLQSGVGPQPRVDAFLLQACASPNPKRNQAAIDDLKACIRDRK